MVHNYQDAHKGAHGQRRESDGTTGNYKPHQNVLLTVSMTTRAHNGRLRPHHLAKEILASNGNNFKCPCHSIANTAVAMS